jgi:hypothetical protein
MNGELNTPSNRRVQDTLNLLLGLTTLWFVATIVVSFFPFKTVEYENQYLVPVLNADKKVRAGDTLIFRLKWCKYINSPTRLGKRFVNEVVISLPQQIVNAPVGCDEAVVRVQVPDFLPEGQYYLDMTATNRILFREITVPYRTEMFQIIK